MHAEHDDAADGVSATWLPDPERRYKWPSGLRTGPGLKFVPDGNGGGTITGRSKTTMRWVVLCRKSPHSAGEQP